MRFDRTNTSPVGRWWWTVDRLTLTALMALICAGAIMITAASPPVALRLGYERFYFVNRHYVYLLFGALIMIGLSFMNPQQIRRLGTVGFIVSLLLLMIVPFAGVENNGSRRWLYIMGTSVQPSEILKPCFAVVMAWILAQRHKYVDFPSFRIAAILYAVIIGLLLLQPDFGMSVTMSGIWGAQLFLAGLPFFWILLLVVLAVVGVWSAYMLFPHVTKRIDSFLDPASGDNYQVSKSLEAFQNGSVLGRGPGEGEVKQFIPDSHTDFIFAVAGEEFGLIVCLMIVMLFAFVVMRGLTRIWKETDGFVVLATAGLLAQFGIQAIVNMGVTVNLLPAKGMTLPFLSYGGSSLISIALCTGMLLALTRRRFGHYER